MEIEVIVSNIKLILSRMKKYNKKKREHR